jgi:hypothetical protein
MLLMKALKIALVAAMTAGFALAAPAQNERKPAAPAGHEAAPSAAAPQSASDAGARMMRLEATLDSLEAQMKRVRAVSDPAERSRLLGGHARSLRWLMADVRELDRALSPQMRAMMGGGKQGVLAEKMMLAHDLLLRRVALMERLTEQVMEQAMGHGEEAPR